MTKIVSKISLFRFLCLYLIFKQFFPSPSIWEKLKAQYSRTVLSKCLIKKLQNLSENNVAKASS